MLAISCLHCWVAARCRAESASLPTILHLGIKSVLGVWCAPSTLPGSPGKRAAGTLATPSRLSLKLRLLDGSCGTTSSPAGAIPRSWVFCRFLAFPPRRLLPFLCALAAVPPVLSNLLLHLPLFFPDKEFAFSQSELSFFESWLLWSGSLDRLVFL